MSDFNVVHTPNPPISVTVSGGVGPQGPAGPAGGVASVNGAVGALTLAAVGGTWTVAGTTLTLTVTSASVSWGDITGKPATFAPSAHTHPISDVTGLQAELDGKQPAGSYAAAAHTHPIFHITGLQTTLDAKAAAVHTHTASAITDFSTAALAAVTWTTLTGRPTFAAVATSGAYSDLSGTPSPYTLPTATASVLGGVKIGSGISIDGNGVISASAGYTLPAATTSTLGGVIVGTGLSVSTGTVSVSYGTTAGTACEGNDARLSDARTPTSHVHAGSDITTGTVAVDRLPVVLEKPDARGNSGSTITLSLGTGSVQTMTLSDNCVVTMPAATNGASITLIVTQGGGFTCTFTGVLWPGGTAPTITATATAKDILVFVSDGTSWFGTAAQGFA